MDDQVEFPTTSPPPPSVVMQRLDLHPPNSGIRLPNSQSYIAIGHGSDGNDYPITAGTTFTLQQADGALLDSCPDGICHPPEPGEYIIAGTFTQPAGPSPTVAVLSVVAGSGCVERWLDGGGARLTRRG